MKHYRLLGILLMLENHPVLTAKTLADHFEVSVRTIYRDLDCLSEAGYSIVTESGKGGGVQLSHVKRLRVNGMDENELIRLIDKLALYDAKDPIDHNLLLKIRSQLPPESQEVLDKLLSRFLVDSKSWFGVAHEDSQLLIRVQKAILNNQKIQFDYSDAKQSFSRRCVHPQGIVKKAGVFYLVGFCELRAELRTFKLMQIKNCDLMPETFSPVDAFDLKAYWRNSIGSFRPSSAPQSPVITPAEVLKYPVKFKSKNNPQQLLLGFKVHRLSDDLYICDLISESVAKSQLLRIADQVTVLSPESLKLSFIEKAKAILDCQRE